MKIDQLKANQAKDNKAMKEFRLKVKRISECTEINFYETEEEKQQRIAALKKDYNAFVNYYFERYATAPCAPFHLKLASKVKRDKQIKLLLGWARGLAKSTHCDLMIPMWLWANGDLKVMLLVGQNGKKANKLLSDIQAEFEGNQRLQNDYGNQLSGGGDWQNGNFVTQNDCAFFSLGMGESPRGIRHRQHRPDYIICDDLDTKMMCRNPKRVRETANWICEDLIPCMGAGGGRFIDVNNVFAKHTILTELRDTRQNFEYWQQDATDAEFNPTWSAFTKKYYVDLAGTIGILSFQAEYNNKPYVEGTVFKDEMIQWAEIPHLNHFDHIVAFWDVAYSDSKTADFNAIKVWGLKGTNFYLIKAFVRQCKMYDAIRWMFDYNKSLPPSVHINFYFESQFWNDALRMVYEQVQAERGCSIPLIRSERTKTNKFDRIVSMLPFYEQGRIFYNIKEKASNDMQVGIAQLLATEEGSKEHDDSPDADNEAISKLSKHIQFTTFTPRFGKREHNNTW